jgi:hypothetical protein
MPRIVDLYSGLIIIVINCRFTACIRNLKRRNGITSCYLVHYLDHENYTSHLRLPPPTYPRPTIIVENPALEAARSFRFPGR